MQLYLHTHHEVKPVNQNRNGHRNLTWFEARLSGIESEKE